MSLFLHSHYKLAKASLKHHRTRTFLSCLGIAIGVASLILIFNLTTSLRSLLSHQPNITKDDLIIIHPYSSQQSSNLFHRLTFTLPPSSSLSAKDLEHLSSLEQLEFIVPLSFTTHTLKAERTVNSATVLGTNSKLQPLLDLKLRAGSFLPDLAPGKTPASPNSAVIGKSLSLQLFGTADPIGQTFTLQNQKFLVIGVLSSVTNPINSYHLDFDNVLIVNFHQLSHLDPTTPLHQINLKLSQNFTPAIDTAADAVQKLLSTKKTNQNFSISTKNRLSLPSNPTFELISLALAIITSISLLIGGIGVMNIMLVSVAERRHEIGIRISLGAAPSHIFFHFLFESLIICLTGGLLGLLFGHLATLLISATSPIPPTFSSASLLLTLLTSLSVGLIFGLYPAVKASLHSPIDSLKPPR